MKDQPHVEDPRTRVGARARPEHDRPPLALWHEIGRRRRLWSTLLVPGQFLLALALVGAEVGTLAGLGLRLGSGLPAVLAWLVVVLPVVLWFAEWAQRRAAGVTILGPRDARHTLGSGAAAVMTSRQHAPSAG